MTCGFVALWRSRRRSRRVFLDLIQQVFFWNRELMALPSSDDESSLVIGNDLARDAVIKKAMLETLPDFNNQLVESLIQFALLVFFDC